MFGDEKRAEVDSDGRRLGGRRWQMDGRECLVAGSSQKVCMGA